MKQLDDTPNETEQMNMLPMKKKVAFVILATLMVTSAGISESPHPYFPVEDDSLLKNVDLSVDCQADVGPLSLPWKPSISLQGLGAEKIYIAHASLKVIEDFTNEIGMDGGTIGVQLELWKLDNPLGTIDKYDPYLQIIRDNGGKPLIRIVGTPKYLQDPIIYDEHPDTYMGYPANDLDGWKNLMYNLLKYIVIPDETVSDPNLFGGLGTPVPTLGLGDDIFFGFWNGIWGPDKFQWRGTEEELMAQWDYTVQAVFQLEADYPGIDIEIGGMGWNTPWEFNHFEPGQLVDNWMEYSMVHGLTIDFVDISYKNSQPFALSMPYYDNRDFVGLTRGYLIEHGFDPETPIINGQWQTIHNVHGEISARGYPISGIEIQSHIMAAHVPTRIFDMESAGIMYHHREAIQDYNSGNYPLFMDDREPHVSYGALGLYTIGLDSEKWYGLRKPEFNAWKMISMLKDRRLQTRSSAVAMYDNQATINLIGTKDSSSGNVAILIWYYLNPNILGEFPVYSDLLSTFPEVDATLEITGLETESNYVITKFELSESISNSFTLRNEIYDLLLTNSSMSEINSGVLFNLVPIEERSLVMNDRIQEYFILEPYGLLMFLIEKDEITDIGDNSDPSASEMPNVPIIAHQNRPNPFNPTTQIRFTVREINENEENNSEDIGKRKVSVEIYDIRGRLVRELLNNELAPGDYSVTWNGMNKRNQPSSSGIYIYRISTSGYRVIKKMTLVK